MFITICRQYGAGGSEIARRVADALGWSVIDNDLVDRVAARAGLPPEEVARLEERTPTFVERLSRIAAMELPELFVPTPGVIEGFEESKLVKVTQTVVTELASAGRVVVVGRGAAAVLAQESDALHVRVVASESFRIGQARERLGLDRETAARTLEEVDGNRARYHREDDERDGSYPVYYDLVLNTERLGIPGAADLIVARAHALGWEQTRLGVPS
jgi:cytidylate kinase